MLRRFRTITLGLAVVAAGACNSGSSGGSPTGPSPTPPPSGVASVAGTWRGTSDFQQNGVRYISEITMSVTQSDRSVQGTVTFTSQGWEGWRGSFSGTLAGASPASEFIGPVTIQSNSSTGTGLCTGQATMSGPTSTTAMRWETPSIAITSNVPTQPPHACQGTVYTVVWILGR